MARLGGRPLPGVRNGLDTARWDPAADALLRKERPGSRARVAPRDLLLAYAQPAAWQISPAPLITPEMEEQLAELEQLDLLADGGAA